MKYLPIAILLIIAGLLFYFGLFHYLTFDSLKTHRQLLLNWTAQHYIQAVLLYSLIYIITVACSIPGATILTLAGGFLFGWLLGSLYVVVSATLGAVLLFLAVKLAFREWMLKRTSRWIKRMEKGFQQNAFSYLLFLRFIPLFPFWLVNIIPALLGVRLRTFFVATFLGIIPGSMVYVSVGNGLGKIFDQNKTPDFSIIFSPAIFLPLIGLAVLSLLPVGYRIYKRKNKD
jgi:uncharacterized membrane protein YdjX (TVP38/TMEM64 family)